MKNFIPNVIVLFASFFSFSIASSQTIVIPPCACPKSEGYQAFMKDFDGDGWYVYACVKPGDAVPELYTKAPWVPYPYTNKLGEPIDCVPISGDCNDHDPSKQKLVTYGWDEDGDGYRGKNKNYCASQYQTWRDIILIFGSQVVDPKGEKDCDDNDETIWGRATIYLDNDGDKWIKGTILGTKPEVIHNVCVVGTKPLKELPGYEKYIFKKDIKGERDCNDANPDLQKSDAVWIDEDGDGYPLNYNGQPMCLPHPRPASPPPGYLYQVLVNKPPIDCDDKNPDIGKTFVIVKDFDNDDHYLEIKSFCAPLNFMEAGWKIYDPAKHIEGDCDDENANAWIMITVYKDADMDGYIIDERKNVCWKDEPWPDPAYIQKKFSKGIDCDDSNPNVWRKVNVRVDKDGDGFPSTGTIKLCIGDNLPDGYMLDGPDLTYDCNDNDKSVQKNITCRIPTEKSRYHTVRICATGCPPGSLLVIEGKENSIFEDVSVYPNPANQQINLVSSAMLNQKIELILSDQFGRVVKSKILPSLLKGQVVSIITADLKPGIYQLTIKRGEMVESKPIAVKL
jgi:hypothetical protein